jgi:hypothetical protein
MLARGVLVAAVLGFAALSPAPAATGQPDPGDRDVVEPLVREYGVFVHQFRLNYHSQSATAFVEYSPECPFRSPKPGKCIRSKPVALRFMGTWGAFSNWDPDINDIPGDDACINDSGAAGIEDLELKSENKQHTVFTFDSGHWMGMDPERSDEGETTAQSNWISGTVTRRKGASIMDDKLAVELTDTTIASTMPGLAQCIPGPTDWTLRNQKSQRGPKPQGTGKAPGPPPPDKNPFKVKFHRVVQWEFQDSDHDRWDRLKWRRKGD